MSQEGPNTVVDSRPPVELTASEALALEGFSEIAAPPTWRRYLSRIWQARDFIRTLASARLHAANQGTALGMLWHLANPLLMAGVFLLVFGYILQVSRGQGNYPAFLVIGIFTFTYASRIITSGATAPRKNIKLMSSIHVPRAVFPLAAAVEQTIAFLPAVVTMMVLTVLTGGVPHLTWLLTIPALLLEGLFATGMALALARPVFRYRDVEQILPFLLRMWLYLSGIFYGVDLVRERGGETVATLFSLNPMFVFIDLNRSLIMDAAVIGSEWATGAAWAVGAVLVGIVIFRGGEQTMGNG